MLWALDDRILEGAGGGTQNSLYFQYERKKQNKTRVSSLEVYVSKRHLSNFYL